MDEYHFYANGEHRETVRCTVDYVFKRFQQICKESHVTLCSVVWGNETKPFLLMDLNGINLK